MKVDSYAVFGNPVDQSKSPLLHHSFAQQTDQHIDYKAILVATDSFPQAIKIFQEQGGYGFNVTLPFKQQAWELMDECDASADLARAVNAVDVRTDGRLIGYNFDGLGLVRDLTNNYGIKLQGQQILICGAGGAVRGVLGPLLAQQPEQIYVVNRTVSKAEALLSEFGFLGHITAGAYTDLCGQKFDLIINATSASLNDEVPPLPDDILAENGCCYDMVYADQPTAFLRWADQHFSTVCIDGLGMLIEQAAESFYLWRGVRPQTDNLYKQLRNST